MAVGKAVASTSLSEVVDRAVDKGLVADALVRTTPVGVQILALEDCVVVASVETHVEHAEPSV